MKKILTFGVIGFLVVAAFALVMTLNAKEANACIPGVNCGGTPCYGEATAEGYSTQSGACEGAERYAMMDTLCGENQICVEDHANAYNQGCSYSYFFGWASCHCSVQVWGTCGSNIQ